MLTNIYKAAVDKWGPKLQMIVAIEEMAELTKEITKVLRDPNDGAVISNIREEIADVEIMLGQRKTMYGMAHFEKFRKIQRLKRRIEG